MTNAETVRVLLEAMVKQGPAAEEWMGLVVERLHAAGYMLVPETCDTCDRWLTLSCSVCGVVPEGP